MDQALSIAEFAEAFGVTPRTLRFYEQKGILKPVRRGRTRLYSERDKIRLKLTLRGKRLGFSLNECINIINMYDSSPAAENLQLLHLCRKIREHRVQLISKMKDIEETLSAMDSVEEQCLAQLLEDSSVDKPESAVK
ncbi:MAG: MerR family DNA-binding transcriptional regulator [Xanthomonadales bacterium]|nr:MerR family DNA-binding transcriptional regulator [Xanthomonadales bacterium]